MQEGQTQKSPHVRAKSSQLGDQQLDCVIVDQFRKRSRKGRYKKPCAGPGSQSRWWEDLSVILGDYLLSFTRTTLN